MILLDTDHLTLLEYPDTPGERVLRTRLTAVPVSEVCSSIVSFEEKVRGWFARIAKAKNLLDQIQTYRKLHRTIELFCGIRILDFDEVAGTHFQNFKRQKIRIGTMDLKIAAIARAYKATLLSRNLQDFQQIPGLKVEDWTQE